MKLWIARNENNYLFGYEQEPLRSRKDGVFLVPHCACRMYSLDNNLFPEITWETEPIRVEIKYKKAGAVKCTEKQIEQALYWQRKYDELDADCQKLFSIVLNLIDENSGNTEKPTFLEFNDPHGIPSFLSDMLRMSALWDFRKKWIEEKCKRKSDKENINLDNVIKDFKFYMKHDKDLQSNFLAQDLLRKLQVLHYGLNKE